MKGNKLMDKVQAGITFILSLITFGTVIYKLVIKNIHKREDEYYKKVLKPFIIEYSNNKNINAAKYIKRIVNREDDYVPKYIFYLLDNNSKEELKKVLIMDYFDLYNNDTNNIMRVSNYLQKALLYVGMIFVLIFLSVGIGLLVLCILSLIISLLCEICKSGVEGIKLIDWEMYINSGSAGGLCVLIGYGIAKLHLKVNIDRYSIKEKFIKKIIDKKVEEYRKYYNEYVA